MTFTRMHVAALFAAITLACLPAPAVAQQNVGTLFFLNSAYDSVATGHVDHQSIFQPTYESGNWAGYTPSSGSTKVINTANGFLVYEPASGAARVVRISHEGQPAKGKKYWLSPNWDQIVGSGTFLFFYRADGAAAIGHITPDGSFVQTQGWGPGTFGAWTHVRATDSSLVFYNKATGALNAGYISFNGYWAFQVATWAMPNCDILTSLGRYLICYNSVNGYMEVFDGVRSGYPMPTHVVQVGAGFSHVVRHGRSVVFYANSSGAAQFGRLDERGMYVVTHETSVLMDLFHFVAKADSVASTGDALLFYNAQYGAAIVGTVDHGGQFRETHAFALTPWWSSIVATAAR